jgi:hypothetical protein
MKEEGDRRGSYLFCKPLNRYSNKDTSVCTVRYQHQRDNNYNSSTVSLPFMREGENAEVITEIFIDILTA